MSISREAYQKAVNDSNGNLSAAGRLLGVSREAVRAAVSRHSLYVPDGHLPKEVIAKCVDNISSGRSEWQQEALRIDVTYHRLRKEVAFYGYSSKDITQSHSKNRWNGRVFGNWSVIDGSYANSSVGIRCVCGKTKRGLMGNLLGGATKSCGCIGLQINTRGSGSSTTIWTCKQTQEKVLSTSALARLLKVNRLILYRRLHLNRNYIDAQGREWSPTPAILQVHSTRDLESERSKIIEMMKNNVSVSNIAKQLKISLKHLTAFLQNNDLMQHSVFYRRITSEEIEEMVKLRQSGHTFKSIGEHYSICESHAHRLIKKYQATHSTA